MDALRSAKHRTVRREGESGAIMFLVAMTLAVLGAVGVYALAAAATEVKTSGNERQNTQTHYLAQYGVLAATDFLSSRAQNYLQWAQTPPSGTRLSCESLNGILPTDASTRSACWVLNNQTDFAPVWGGVNPIETYSGTPFSGGTPGSFGQVPVTGNFFVELTTIEKAPAPTRNQLGTIAYCFVTLTSYAFTQPSSTIFLGEGQESQRARIVVGPVPANVCP